MVSQILLTLLLAQPGNPYLDEGRRLVKDLHFAEAIEQLKVARQVRELSSAQRLEVLALLGHCQVAEGARAEAESTFAQMLALEPNAELDRNLSPKILEVFDGVKQRIYPNDFVRLSPEPARKGQAVIRIIDPWRRIDAVVAVRRVLGKAGAEQPMVVKDGQVTIELDVKDGETLEWWLEARDAAGQVLVGFGSAQNPQAYWVPAVASPSGPFAPPPAPSPRLERVPAWVALGLAVAAGIGGAAMQVKSMNTARQAQDNTKPPGDWADTARAARSAAMTDATIATSLFLGAGVASATGVVLFAW